MNHSETSRPDRRAPLLEHARFLAEFAQAARLRPSRRQRTDRAGILLVAFGSSIPQARVAFERIDRHFSRRFADLPLRWAFSSPIIRRKLALEPDRRPIRAGGTAPEPLDSLTHALARMMDDGFTHVAVQSLHTIPGFEYEQLRGQVRRFQAIPGAFRRLVVGAPLLHSEADLDRAAQVAIRNLPPRPEGVAAVLMGHGTWHAGGAFYEAVHRRVRALDPAVWIGAMDGALSVENILDDLKKAGARRVWLAPFMSVAGEHAVNDMAGDDLESWKSVLTQAGLEVTPIMKGTAEFDDYVAIWADHLADAVAGLIGEAA